MPTRRTSFFAGVLAGAAMTAVAFTAGSAGASGGQPTGQQTRKYALKVVVENDRVRVRDVTFPFGVLDTGLHTHDLPHVGVILTPGSLTFTEPGKPSETTKFEAGNAGYREANVTHMVANPGKTPMRVIEVELK